MGVAEYDIARALRPVQWRVGPPRLVHYALNGTVAGLLLALALSRIQLSPGAWALAIPIVTAAIGTAVGLLRWPNLAESARLVDGTLALDDRLTTALELREATDIGARLQRDDTRRRLAGVPLGRSIPLHIPWPSALMATAAFVALLLVPRPHQASLLAVDRARIQHVALVTVPHLERAARHTAAAQPIHKALHTLRRHLLHASTRAAALHAVSDAQQQLRAALRQPDPSRISAALRAGLGQNTLPQNGTSSVRSLLHQAAGATTRLSPRGSRALEQSLRDAAAAAGVGGLSRDLQRAAGALHTGRRRLAASDLGQAANSKDLFGVQGAKAQLISTLTKLDLAKNEIAGLSHATAPSPGNQAARVDSGIVHGRSEGGSVERLGNPATGAHHARSIANMLGAGHAPNTFGQSEVNQGHRFPGRGTHRGGRGGIGAGGNRVVAGRATGHYVTVRIPGPTGMQTIRLLIAAGQGIPQRAIPHQSLLARYSRSARLTLDRESVPPALEHVVLRYFNAVSR